MSKSEEEEHVEWLRKSREQIGEKNPVLVMLDGTVIDGAHRLKAYPGWRTETVNISRKEMLIERIHRNLHRKVSRQERKAQIGELALWLKDEGVNPENMVTEMAKRIPFTERYIRMLLPPKYKGGYPVERELAARPWAPAAVLPPSEGLDQKPEMQHEPIAPIDATGLNTKPISKLSFDLEPPSEAALRSLPKEEAETELRVKGTPLCPICYRRLLYFACPSCLGPLVIKGGRVERHGRP